MTELGAQRHHARERALEIMYEAEMKGRPVAVVLDELNLTPEAYTVAILTSAEANLVRANELIGAFAIGWPLERIAVIDRLVMTLAIGEMLLDDPPPTPVILDEAVELAKVYSTDRSGAFVNGILSSVANALAP